MGIFDCLIDRALSLILFTVIRGLILFVFCLTGETQRESASIKALGERSTTQPRAQLWETSIHRTAVVQNPLNPSPRQQLSNHSRTTQAANDRMYLKQLSVRNAISLANFIILWGYHNVTLGDVTVGPGWYHNHIFLTLTALSCTLLKLPVTCLSNSSVTIILILKYFSVVKLKHTV